MEGNNYPTIHPFNEETIIPTEKNHLKMGKSERKILSQILQISFLMDI